MAAPDDLLKAVANLSAKSGILFQISDGPIDGTSLYAVYSASHPLPDHYSQAAGIFGFRIPKNFPDACPEDCFFIQPPDMKLKTPDCVRRNNDINRAAASADFLKGTLLGNKPALVFSWHLWDRSPWNRNKHSLLDHYTHCLRRFEQPEHD